MSKPAVLKNPPKLTPQEHAKLNELLKKFPEKGRWTKRELRIESVRIQNSFDAKIKLGHLQEMFAWSMGYRTYAAAIAAMDGEYFIKKES